jgi:hypothetical protein
MPFSDVLGSILNVVLFYLLTGFVAGLGAYYGSYLKKKGENTATHEDIEKLVDQVTAVTHATKEIEARISNEVWDRQRQWELKKELLMKALANLANLQANVIASGSLNVNPPPEYVDDHFVRKLREKRDELSAGYVDSLLDFFKANVLASFCCGLEVLRAFQKATVEIMQASENRDYMARTSQISAAMSEVVKAVRAELGFVA